MKSLRESLIFEFSSVQTLKAYNELSSKYKGLVYKNDKDTEPSDNGSIHYDEKTGDEFAFTITNYGWESDIIPKFEKAANKAGLTVAYNNDDDMTILNPIISKWMDDFNVKMTKFVEKSEVFNNKGGRMPKPVSKEDFDRFTELSKETSYLQYNDYNYNDVKQLIDDYSNISKTDNNKTYSTIKELEDALDKFLFKGKIREYKVFNMSGELFKDYSKPDVLEEALQQIMSYDYCTRGLKIDINGNKVKITLLTSLKFI